MIASRRSRGFSLFEMLAALVVLALATGLVVSRIAGSSVTDRADRAAETLVDDLRRAQLLARGRAVVVPVFRTETGYRIDGLSIVREWPIGLVASWQRRDHSGWSETHTLNMAGRPLSREEARIVMRIESVERVVKLDPISGRIHVDQSTQR